MNIVGKRKATSAADSFEKPSEVLFSKVLYDKENESKVKYHSKKLCSVSKIYHGCMCSVGMTCVQ